MNRRHFLNQMAAGAALAGLTFSSSGRLQSATAGQPQSDPPRTSSDPLRITRVRAYLTAPSGIRLVVVKVETSEPGLYGLGCGTFTQRARTVVTAVNEYLDPFLRGMDPDNIEDLWQAMFQSSYWRNGPVLNNAISGVDQALWDIKGKQAGMPVYQLLGGKSREAAAVYVHANGHSKEEVADRAEQLREAGHRHIRIQMGGYGGEGRGFHKPADAPAGNYFDPRAYGRSMLEMIAYVRDRVGDGPRACEEHLF